MIRAAILFWALMFVPVDAFASGMLDRARRGETTSVNAGDKRMRAAFSRARATLPTFLRLLDTKPAHIDYLAIKLAIAIGDGRNEFFWISSLRRDGRGFIGSIANRPNFATHVSEGQEIRFTQSQIVDWTYRDQRTDRMFGNYTACALLAYESPEEQRRFKDAIGLRCDTR